MLSKRFYEKNKNPSEPNLKFYFSNFRVCRPKKWPGSQVVVTYKIKEWQFLIKQIPY